MSRTRACLPCLLAVVLFAGPLVPSAWAQGAAPPPLPPPDSSPKAGDASEKTPLPSLPGASSTTSSPAPRPASGSGSGAASASASGQGSASAATTDSTVEQETPAGPAEWAQRDIDIAEQNTLTGGAGLLRTQHAQTNAPGQFRLSFVGDWFSAGFLCTSSFPCPDPNGGAPITSDTMSHVGGTLALGVSIAKLGPGILDGSAAIVTYANSDGANRPGLLQVLGDTVLGVRYVAPVGDVLHLGVDTDLWLINGSGSVGLDGSATSARFAGLATADLRGLSSPVPVRFSANIAYFLDNTGDVVASTESARNQPVTRIERYGLGVNRVDHVDFLIGAEALLADGRARPFVESRIIAANNRQGYVCTPTNVGFDNCLKNDTVVPAVLTLGGRFFPWKREFSLLAALDIGLSGTSNFIEEVQPVPPWTLFLGLGWAADSWDRPVQKVVEKTPEVAPRTVHVVGFVHEKDKNDPVSGAILAYRNRPELSRLASGPDGKFADDLPHGTYAYEIKADGFKPSTCEFRTQAPVLAPSQPGGAKPAAQPAATDAAKPSAPGARAPSQVEIDCSMEALPRLGTVIGRLRDAESSQPLSGTQVVLTDAQRKEVRATSDASGAVRFENVAPGTATMSILADGYLALVTPEEVKARQENTVELLLQRKPSRPEVKVTSKEITIRDQIQFALDSAIILPQSFGILTEVADTLIRHGEIKRIEVQGHTDNSGTPDHNQTLSEDRAQAVRSWLAAHGVPLERLLARGYGQSRPLAPNVTATNRAQNRRVQFIIVEKEGGGEPTRGALPGF
jgi:outer membrane protein OmpA-like peptidoglycan-associated protein